MVAGCWQYPCLEWSNFSQAPIAEARNLLIGDPQRNERLALADVRLIVVPIQVRSPSCLSGLPHLEHIAVYEVSSSFRYEAQMVAAQDGASVHK
ncbi:100k [Anopheles sinensis]|uniref:100k n=1 Tax=Anopheles sinensis TaxID=74873 RepID=A0A084WFQ7_ANOSI|nr:100k [Anopheles sinensis]